MEESDQSELTSVLFNERNEQRTTKTYINHFSTARPKRISKADVLLIGMVDHYMVYGIRKVNACRLKKEKQAESPGDS